MGFVEPVSLALYAAAVAGVASAAWYRLAAGIPKRHAVARE
jgi:hypothetical protein